MLPTVGGVRRGQPETEEMPCGAMTKFVSKSCPHGASLLDRSAGGYFARPFQALVQVT
jgi:hypothetical protein